MVPFFFLPYQLFMYRVTKVHVYVLQQMVLMLNRAVSMLWIRVVGFFRFQSWAHRAPALMERKGLSASTYKQGTCVLCSLST